MKSDNPKPETFDDACGEFVAFLASQGRPTALRWFCREDVTAHRRRVRVSSSSPDCNRTLYERYFRHGITRGLGLRLEASFFTDGTSWCHVWCPKDDVAASQAMMGGGLHFSVSSDPPQTTAHSRFAVAFWRAFDSLRGMSPFVQFIPSRSWLETLT